MTRESAEHRYERLYYKYAHVGCPAARMEDNCAHPDRCADNGRCLDLGPNPFDKPTGCNHWPGQKRCGVCGMDMK